MTAIAIEMRRTLSDILCPRSRYARLTTGVNAAVHRYAAKKNPAKGQKELRWITIGGGDEGGGTHVQVDGDGKITAGPKGLADKGVKKLSDFGGERDGGATTAQRPKESGVTESEAASRKWKKNDDGTYTAPNGTVWKKAAAGGEESPVNGNRYAGGSLMPIHGLSEKPAKQKPAESRTAAPSSAGKPNEDAKRKPSAAMTPEQIAAEKEAREDRRKWSELSSGPMGKLKWLGESPNHRAMKDSRINLKEWTEFADQIGPEATSALAENLKEIAHKRIDDATAAARKNAVSGMPIPNDAEQWQKDQIGERAGEDARLHGMKKHVKGNPDSLIARQLVQEILDNDNNPSGKSAIDNLLDVNRILSDAAKPPAPKPATAKPSGPKSFSEIAAEHTAPIVADMKSGDMNAASQKFDALMGQTKAKQFEAHMLRQKLQDEAGIKQKTRAERKAEARGEVATSDEAAKPVGSPDGGMPTANPAAGATDNSDPIVPKVGEIHEFPAIGNRGPMRLKVTSHANGNVGIGMADSNLTWVQIPEESFPQFVGDMQGKVRVAANSGDPHIDRISSGQAKLLGKGDDGLVFDTGDGKVTKVSTTTPFVPLNPFHKTPDEAKRRAIDQFNVAKTLHKAGVPGIPRMSVKEHDGRVFTTRENLTIPDRLNEKQFRQAVDSVRKMHNAGYSVNDEIQIGVGADGNVYHFDLGKAAKAEHPDDFKSDQSRLDRLAESHGLKKRFINPQTEWKSYQEMLARRTDADKRQEEKGKTGKLVGEFRRIVADDVGRLRDQLTEDAPHESDRIGREFDEMMGRVSAAPTAPAPAPSTPAAPKPTVPGAQSGLFDRGELATGQKSLFNVVRPAKGGKKPVAPDLLSSVTADVRAHLERKGTLSPADIAGTSIQAESLEGQKEMFSRVRDAVERGIARYRLVGGSRY